MADDVLRGLVIAYLGARWRWGRAGGVLLAQRSERKRAHADRVWERRVAIYSRVYRWADHEQRRASGVAFIGASDALTKWSLQEEVQVRIFRLDAFPRRVKNGPGSLRERKGGLNL